MSQNKLPFVILIVALAIISTTLVLLSVNKPASKNDYEMADKSSQLATSSIPDDVHQDLKPERSVIRTSAENVTEPSQEMMILDKDGKPTYFYKDSSHVWISGEMPPTPFLIHEADPKTFIPLKFPYSKDSHNVYFWDTPIKGADINTFRVVSASTDFPFGADQYNVFSGHKVLEGADPSTFEFIIFDGTNYVYRAKDKNRQYELNTQMFVK